MLFFCHLPSWEGILRAMNFSTSQPPGADGDRAAGTSAAFAALPKPSDRHAIPRHDIAPRSQRDASGLAACLAAGSAWGAVDARQ
jgi:hypothetical protein